ncbi:hypothetical protein IMZ48_36820 [Candidatus Bathyarchaeota archaeon]|nr:hypothetical protein [Candidatus Bathyarchaeota archaeon]
MLKSGSNRDSWLIDLTESDSGFNPDLANAVTGAAGEGTAVPENIVLRSGSTRDSGGSNQSDADSDCDPNLANAVL